MIGKLIGAVESKTTNSVLINCGGVCYEVETPLSTALSLPVEGEKIAIYTHFVVREDAQLLYGFSQKAERDMFRVLIKVNGVGPKLGLTILSGLDSAELGRCVADNDVTTLVKLPGIGKKTAERLLIELRDKVEDFCTGGDGVTSSESSLSAQLDVKAEAEAALTALGYKPQDAAKAIKNSYHADASLEDLIKLALKSML